MATTEKWLRGSTSESYAPAATLANNANSLSGALTITDSGHTLADVTLDVTYSVAPTAGTSIDVYLLREDGSGNYEDGDATPTTPARMPDLVFPVRAVTTAQRIIRQVMLPPGVFKRLVRNNGTGQTMGSGWTLKILPYTRQGV